MNRSSSARRRAEQIRRSRVRANTAPSDNGIFLRLVICGVIFVVLVAVKLLFPETVDRLARSAGELIGRNADFKEAFAAVGRAVSGEEPVADSLQDAYTAVFNPAAPEPEEKPAEPDAEPQPSPAKAGTVSSVQTKPSSVLLEVRPENQLGRYTTPALPELDLNAVSETVVNLDGDVPDQPPAEPDAAGVSESSDTATEALSYVYTMPAMPENASLEQRNLGFAHTSPIQGTLTSTFGWREHPIEGGNKFHYGVDLAAPEGAAIAAFAAGTVYATGESSTLGNYIMLQHDSGYITLYAHCSKVTVTGGSVAMGDKIAEVGDTGLATGPHLHFELHDGDLYLNPIFYVDIG